MDNLVEAEVLGVNVELTDQQVLFMVGPPDFEWGNDGDILAGIERSW